MASTVYHTIALQGAHVRREGTSHESITPGHLLEINTDEELALHSSAGGVMPGKLIALESPMCPPSQLAAIDTPYDANTRVFYAEGQPGDIYNMWLKTGETVVKGITHLVSAGGGELQVVDPINLSTLVESVVGVADQDLTAVGSARVRVRIT